MPSGSVLRRYICGSIAMRMSRASYGSAMLGQGCKSSRTQKSAISGMTKHLYVFTLACKGMWVLRACWRRQAGTCPGKGFKVYVRYHRCTERPSRGLGEQQTARHPLRGSLGPIDAELKEPSRRSRCAVHPG